MADFVDAIEQLHLTEEMRQTFENARHGKRRTFPATGGRFARFFVPDVTARVIWALRRLPGPTWVVYLVLRRRCFLAHKVTDGKMVSLSSTELLLFGLTRKQKYHTLGQLEQRGLIRVRRQNGKNPQVELLPLCLVV